MRTGRLAALATALALAACGATGGASPSAPASFAPASFAPASSAPAPSAPAPESTGTRSPAAVQPTAAPSARSTATPAPTPSCPAGTLTPAQFLAAPPSCYLSNDVAVAGWWGARRDDEPGAEAAVPWLVRGSMPFGLQADGREDLVFVDEVAAVGPAGWPDGVHWATVTGRGSTSTDQGSCHHDRAADVMAPAHCPRYLVASSVVESEPPAAIQAGCSALSVEQGGWVDVQNFTSYPPSCFGSRDVTVRGWLDINYVITGWENPWSITPEWLWLPIGPWTVVAPTSNPTTSSALDVYLNPARAFGTLRTNRWVLLTGHYADAAAKTCRVEYSGGVSPAPGSRVTDAYARRLCEAHFVVTGIRDTSP